MFARAFGQPPDTHVHEWHDSPVNDERPPAPTAPSGPTDYLNAATAVAGRPAWTAAFVGAVAAYALFVVVYVRGTGGSAAYRAGELLPGLVLAGVLVGAATGPTSRLPRWTTALIAAAVMSAYYAVAVLALSTQSGSGAGSARAEEYVLTTPDRASGWQRLNGRGVAARQQQVLDRAASSPAALWEDVDIVYAEYELDIGGRLVFQGINASGRLEEELERSPAARARNLMAGMGLSDPQAVAPGDLGGTLLCVDEGESLPSAIAFCIWADASTIGMVTLNLPRLDVEDAARITRGFRAAATTH